jgi:hypothetical protein
VADVQTPACKDCRAEGITTARPAPHPGPRCVTHHRARRKVRAAGRRPAALRRFGITPEEYAQLFAAQGNRCAICRRATGATKQLAVDHDHSCCPGPTSCGGCVRGLLCGPCNGMLAHARDDAELFHRAVRYLREWPSRTAGI